MTAQNRRLLIAMCIIALALRLGVRLYLGETNFWFFGYQDYHTLATNMQQMNGCLSPRSNALINAGLHQTVLGRKCAYLPPGYPMFLSVVMSGKQDYLAVVLSQAMVSVGVVVCTFLLGEHLFGSTTGLLASLLTTVYPYYVLHDTTMQETGLFTAGIALSVLTLYKAYHSWSWRLWALSGILLGVTALTRASAVPFAYFVVLWVLLLVKNTLHARALAAMLVLACFSLVLSPWLVRNLILLGRPVLTTQTGRFLWIGNNSDTLSHYPSESMDLSEAEAWRAFSPEEIEEIRSLAADEMAQRDWFFRRGVDYMFNNPFKIFKTAVVKIGAGFSWNLSPSRDMLRNRTHLISYLPILVLGAYGLLMTWRRWRELSLIYSLFIAFMVGTAVFWANSSHRSYLDLYLIIFSAHSIRTIGAGRARWLQHARLLFQRRPANMC